MTLINTEQTCPRRICGIMCAVAEQYYKDNKDKFSFNYNIIDWDEEVAKLPPLDIDYEYVFKRIADVEIPSDKEKIYLPKKSFFDRLSILLSSYRLS